MVTSNIDALGIIFPNSYDNQVPELVNERLMASIPFASRYRMIDFILSSMVNCGAGQYLRYRPQKLPFPDPSLRLRPRVGSDPQKWRSERGSTLCGKNSKNI